DPYTTFLPPVEAGPAADHLEGEFGGIGVHIQYIDGRLTVVAPIAGSPADRAGIEPGDVIVEADGVTLSELTPAKAGALIRGPVGSTVELLIERSSALEPVEMEIVREEIETQVVYYDLVPETSIAHLRVTSFTERTIPQLDAALEQALNDGVTGIVLDLRDNGGGLVAAAQALIGRFVPSKAGPALWEDRGASSGALVSLPIAGGEIEAYDLPLIVVVNEGTASAAEIVAGALRDYGRAPLIGEPTFGKGLVQRIWNFDDGSSARITVARWLTPDKSAIPEDGLRVNIAVPLVPSVIDDDPIALRAARALRTEGWSEVHPNW
ncbi:MAG TPA: S41 family peptidase, partial [Thermomicrobiales bacterium]|nr:S41 family peptidase [Thermomicrobiales bacterium]